jgi:hypothetical protein
MDHVADDVPVAAEQNDSACLWRKYTPLRLSQIF